VRSLVEYLSTWVPAWKIISGTPIPTAAELDPDDTSLLDSEVIRRAILGLNEATP
jgi:hypothetical protein